MATKDLTYRLVGKDESASRAMTTAAGTGEKSAKRISSAFSKAGSLIGGEFGEVLTKMHESLDLVGEKGGKGLAAKLAVGGGAVAGLGTTLTMFGSKRMESENQLKAAIESTGGAYEDYEKQIESTIKAQEKFGHQEGDTQEALMKLTAATQSPSKALADMTVVSNLAAAQHESLAAAASQVARVYGGSGKVLKQYGINMDSAKTSAAALRAAERNHETAITALSKAQEHLTQLEEIDHAKKKLTIADQIALKNAHDAVTTAQDRVKTTTQALSDATAKNKTQTQDADAALKKLGDRLSGQASAQADTWGGHLRALRAEVGDFTAMIGQKYGPAITASGTALLGAGSAVEMYRGRQARLAATASEAAAAQEAAAARITAAQLEVDIAEQGAAASAGLSATEQAAAQARVVAAHEEMAAAVTAADAEAGAASSLALGPVGIAIGAVAVAGGLAAGAMHLFGKSTKDQVKPTQDFTNAILADNDALGTNTRKLIENKLEKDGAYDAALKLGIGQKELTDAVMGNSGAMADIRNKTQAADSAFLSEARTLGISTAAHGNNNVVLRALNKDQIATHDSVVKLSDAIGNATDTLNANKQAADNLRAADGKAAKSIDVLTEKLKGLDGKVVSVGVNIVETVNKTAAGSAGHVDVSSFHAGGTDYAAGGDVMVAERETEIIGLPRGSSVTPLSKLRGGGGGGDVHLHVSAPQIWSGSSLDLARYLFGLIESGLQSGLNIRGITN